MIYYTNEDIRFVLQHAGRIKNDGKCIICDGTGYLNWDEDGEDVKPGKHRTEVQSKHGDYTYYRESCECEDCDGIGYIW